MTKVISTHVQDSAKTSQHTYIVHDYFHVEILCTYFHSVVQLRHKGCSNDLSSYLRGMHLGHVLKYLFLYGQKFNKHSCLLFNTPFLSEPTPAEIAGHITSEVLLQS